MTMTKTDYLARVPDVADREESARLYEAMRAAEHESRRAKDAQWQAEVSGVAQEELAALRQAYETKRDELSAWLDGERARILGTGTTHEVEAAEDAAISAYEDAPGGSIMEGDDGLPLRCALSGAPLWESDQIVEFGGQSILACVLLSPEQIEALGGGADDEDDDEIEDAA